MNVPHAVIQLAYVASTALFVFSLHWMNAPRTLQTLARMIAFLARIAPVETTVAIEFAVSWKPLI